MSGVTGPLVRRRREPRRQPILKAGSPRVQAQQKAHRGVLDMPRKMVYYFVYKVLFFVMVYSFDLLPYAREMANLMASNSASFDKQLHDKTRKRNPLVDDEALQD